MKPARLFLVVVALAACHAPPPPPPPPAPPAPKYFATLNLVNQPVGAAVLIDGQPRGQTPGRFQVTADERHDIRLELAGFRPYELAQTLDPDEERELRFELTPKSGP